MEGGQDMSFQETDVRPSLSELIQDLEEGVITPENRAVLMERLRGSASARRLYLRHACLAALLMQTAVTRAELGTMPVSQEMLRRARRNSAWTALAWGVAAVIALFLGLMLFQVRLNLIFATPHVAMESSQDSLYEIERSGAKRKPADELDAGDLIIVDRGLLRFTFPSKVEAVIEGPCEIELISDSEIRLEGGVAWFRVPPSGRGFAVRTDRAKVIDLGTEFGLRFAGDGDLQVHVEKGKVRVEPRAKGAAAFEIQTGEAAEIGETGSSRRVEVRSTLFRRTFSSQRPYLHFSFDHLVDGAFPATGTMPEATSYAARLRRADGQPGEPDRRSFRAEGIRGNALALRGNGWFVESGFPGVGGNAPRTVAAWVRHRGGAEKFVPHGSNPINDPYPGYGATTVFGEQALLLNYAGTGLTTASGAIGEVVTPGTSYSLSFHVAARPGLPDATYRVELVAFDLADDDIARGNCSRDRPGTVLAHASGEAKSHDMSERVEIAYTADARDPNLGKEIGLRLVHEGRLLRIEGHEHHTGRVLYDDLLLTVRREGGEPETLFSEGFESPRVAGYARGTLPGNWIPADGSHGSRFMGLFNRHPPYRTPYLSWGMREPGRMWAGFIDDSEHASWNTATGATWITTGDAAAIPLGKWVHVATVHTGRLTATGDPEILHYLDGRLLTARPASRHPHDGRHEIDTDVDPGRSSPLRIGALPGAAAGEPTLNGDIDELFIFRGALDASEIGTLMETHTPYFPGK
jgi:hypothetical protein